MCPCPMSSRRCCRRARAGTRRGRNSREQSSGHFNGPSGPWPWLPARTARCARWLRLSVLLAHDELVALGVLGGADLGAVVGNGDRGGAARLVRHEVERGETV